MSRLVINVAIFTYNVYESSLKKEEKGTVALYLKYAYNRVDYIGLKYLMKDTKVDSDHAAGKNTEV